MALQVRTEGDKLVFSSEKMRLLLTLFESKPQIIIKFKYLNLKVENRQCSICNVIEDEIMPFVNVKSLMC